MGKVTSVRTLIAAPVSVWLLVAAVSIAAAQDKAPAQTKGTAEAPYLRVEWQFESARGAYQNACGRIFNDRDVAARHVMIMFEGFDTEGKKVSSRFGEVVGDVPPRGYAIFCLQVKSGGTTYQCSIPGVDWGYGGGQ